MANEIHLYATFIGGYDSTYPAMETESWQFGIRFALVFGNLDPVGTLPNNWSPTANIVNRTETHWTITGNWQADGGGGNIFHPDDWLNDQLAPAVSTFLASAHCVSGQAKLNEIKVYPIGTNGKSVPAPPYSQGSPMLLTFTSANPHGSVSGLLPPQLSGVVSWGTEQIGRKGRGRIYLPPTAPSEITGGQLISGTASTIAGNAAAFIEACNVHNTAPYTQNCEAAVIGAPWTQYGVINSAGMDSLLDTQRRRRRSLKATKYVSPVTP